MTTRTVTYVFCDRCNELQMLRPRGTAVILGEAPETKLRKLGWRRYWDGKTRRSKRPIECAECIAEGKAKPAPLFAAGGVS